MLDLSKLNEVQKSVVLQTEGPMMVLAGAGSGKTRTLVSRIIYLLEEKKISPFKVLALTFSNKAAREMRERVASEIEIDLGALQITTFHSFCAKILRSEATYLGLSRNFTIYEPSESKSVVKALLGRRGVTTKEINPFEILYFIDNIKNHGYYPGRNKTEYYEIDTEDPFYSYYQEYESEIHRANAIDFGGLITGVIQLFETHPEVLRRYRDRFQYLLVDEYQDTNRGQFDLVRMLTGVEQNICVVGDEDQSIYSWRGADIRNILDFEKEFPNVEILKLEQNYRSSKNIIEAASCVIQRNEMRKGKSMWTKNPEGESIRVIEVSSDKKEAEFIAKEISHLKYSGTSFKDIAVFYRNNSQSRLIEDYLRKEKINYRIVGGVKFYERKEIKDLLAYIRIIVNPKDSLALSRIINVPTRGIGATTLRKMEDEAVRMGVSLWETVENIIENPDNFTHIRLSAKVKAGIRALVSLINEVKFLNNEKVQPSTLYKKLLHESGYFDFLKASKDYESLARIENLEELTNAINQFEETNKLPTLLGFLETVTLDAQTKETQSDDDSGQVSLMTVHGSKGLEFSYVFVSGAEENIFPSYKSLEYGADAIEEERRLFYVAMTRAMERLYIMFAQGRMLFGQLKFNGPSRFIYEIPNKYYDWQKEMTSSQDQAYREYSLPTDWKTEDFNQEYKESNPIAYQTQSNNEVSKYPKDTLVLHSLYGEGLVLSTEGHGGSEKVLIKFKDGTRKKFMVKYAPLIVV